MALSLYPGGGASSEVVGSAIDDLAKMKFAQKQLNESIKAANAKVMAEAEAAKVRNIHDTGMKVMDFLGNAAREGLPYEMVHEFLKQQGINPNHLPTPEEYDNIVQKQGKTVQTPLNPSPSVMDYKTPEEYNAAMQRYNTPPVQPELSQQINTTANQIKPNTPEYVTGGLPSGLGNQNPEGVNTPNVFGQEIDKEKWNAGIKSMEESASKRSGGRGGSGQGDTFLDYWDKYMKYQQAAEGTSTLNLWEYAALTPEEKKSYRPAGKDEQGNPIYKMSNEGRTVTKEKAARLEKVMKLNFPQQWDAYSSELDNNNLTVMGLYQKYPKKKAFIDYGLKQGYSLQDIDEKLANSK